MAWSKKTLYLRIVDRWKEKDSDYGKVNANRDTMITFFRSDEIVETNEKGQLVGQNIYNGSGPWYSRMMSTGFQGAVVSKNIPWIRYQMEQHELKGIDELDIWNQDIKDHMAAVYQKSNFYDVQPQFTHDGVTTGSPVIFGEEDILNEKTMWMPQHYKTVRLYYDKYNQVEGCITKDDTWTAKQIFDIFVKNDDKEGTKRKEKLTISVNSSLKQGMLDTNFTVYRATFRVTDPLWDSDDNSFKKPNTDHKWLSVYFLELSESDKNKQNTPLNDDIGYFTQPFAVWNFDKKPWEASSRTPAWYAIWDCLSLQQLDKALLENAQMKNRPAVIALDTMRGRLSLGPEGEMLVSSQEYENPPKFLDRVGDININIEMVQMREESLKRWFYIDQLQMFSDLSRDNKQPVSAQQIWRMAGEKSALLGPAIETHSSYLKTTDDRMMDIEIQAGRGPFAPKEMANITDIIESTLNRVVPSVEVQPVFVGALAQAQKASQALEPIQSTIEALAPLLQLNPNLVHKYRWYELAGKIEDANDFPQDVVVPKDEYEAIIARNAEIAAQQLQLENNIEMAKAAPSVSGPVDETSVLAAATGGQG